MAMVVKNNLSAKNTLNTLNKNEKSLSKSLKKVSSGMRVNSAGDDASAYAISERMLTQVRSLDQDDRNAQNGSSLMKVAEGAIDSTVEILTTMKEKALNAATDTNTDADRAQMQKELDQLIDQIDDNANVTYNNKLLIDGSHNKTVVADGTRTCLTNQAFSGDVWAGTKLIELADLDENSLNIQSEGKLTISVVKDGKTQISVLDPIGNTTLDYIFRNATPRLDQVIGVVSGDSYIGVDASGSPVYSANGNPVVTFTSQQPGLDGQIAGLTFCITDRDGNINTVANKYFNNLEETIRAENPSKDNAIVIHTGTKANQALKVPFSDMRSVALGLRGTDGSTLNISTQANANAAINVLDNALSKCLNQQTTIGAVESRLEYTSSNLVTASENTQSSESVIRDADMAKEMTEYTKNNVLTQTAQAMLAQANQNSSSVLSLLQ